MLVAAAAAVLLASAARGAPEPADALVQIAEAARQTTHTARRPDARSKALLQVAEALAEAGAVDEATDVMREAVAVAEQADTRRFLLLEVGESCARAGLFDLAIEVAGKTDYPPHAIHILCAVAEKRAASGTAEDARDALDRAATLAAGMADAEASARAWLRIASAAHGAGLDDESRYAVGHAVEAALDAANPLVTATLIEGAAEQSLECGRFDAAVSFAAMIDAPDVAVPVYVKLAGAAAEEVSAPAERLLRDAAVRARNAGSPYRRALLLAKVAVAYDGMGEGEEAGGLFEEARRAAGAIEGDLRAATARSALVDALIATGRPGEAEAVARTDSDSFRRGEQLVRIALALTESGEYAEAVRLTALADADYLKYGAAPSLRALGLAYYHAWGRAAPAAKFDALQPSELRDAVLAVYAEELAGEGQLRAALDYALMIEFAVTRADAIIGVALRGVADAESEPDLAFPTSCMDHVEVVGDQLRLLAALAVRQAELGLAIEARKTLETLLERREEATTPTARAAASGAAAAAFRLLGSPDEARDTACEAMEAALKVGCTGCRDEVIEDLLDELGHSANLVLAIDALEVIDTPSLRVHNALRLLRLKPDAAPDRREHLARMALAAATDVPSLDRRVEFLLAAGKTLSDAGLSLTEDEQAALRRSYEGLPENAQWVVKAAGPGYGGEPAPIQLVFFDKAGCARCDEVEAQFEQLQEMYPQLEITTYNLTGSDGAQLLNTSICRALKVPEEQRMVAPALFSLRRGLVGSDLTLSSMAELAEEAQGMLSPAQAYAPVDTEILRSEIRTRYENLGLLVVVSAGLLDGINPCAFSVIIFFLSYLAYLGKNRREIAAVGIVFTVAVFLTYFAIGLFLSGLVTAADAWSGNVTRIIYGATALLAFVVAVLSYRDARRCQRGEAHEMSLALPESLRSRIRLTISRRARMGLTIGATLVLGVVVAFFEAPCTGQVYWPTIMFALNSLPQYFWGPVGWLLIYNVCFIIPLIAVFVAVMFGLTSERLAAVFRRHLAKTKFAMAGFFLVLGVAMVVYMLRS